MFGRNVNFGKSGVSQFQNKQSLVFHLTVHTDGKLGGIGVVPFRFGLNIDMNVNLGGGFDFSEDFRRMRNFQR